MRLACQIGSYFTHFQEKDWGKACTVQCNSSKLYRNNRTWNIAVISHHDVTRFLERHLVLTVSKRNPVAASLPVRPVFSSVP